MRFRRVVVAVLALFALTPAARAEHTRVSDPNFIGIEFFGRGLMMSLIYDRTLGEDLAAGGGFGLVGMRNTDGSDADKTAFLLPIYMNYYFKRDEGSPLISAGATMVLNSFDVKDLKANLSGVEFSSIAFQPNIGFGYEYRADAGFLFRAMAYGILAKNIHPWFGATLGYAF